MKHGSARLDEGSGLGRLLNDYLDRSGKTLAALAAQARLSPEGIKAATAKGGNPTKDLLIQISTATEIPLPVVLNAAFGGSADPSLEVLDSRVELAAKTYTDLAEKLGGSRIPPSSETLAKLTLALVAIAV